MGQSSPKATTRSWSRAITIFHWRRSTKVSCATARRPASPTIVSSPVGSEKVAVAVAIRLPNTSWVQTTSASGVQRTELVIGVIMARARRQQEPVALERHRPVIAVARGVLDLEVHRSRIARIGRPDLPLILQRLNWSRRRSAKIPPCDHEWRGAALHRPCDPERRRSRRCAPRGQRIRRNDAWHGRSATTVRGRV
jgi:hypothetical protein